jgi:dTDP-4-dehydrorhamnose reductase
MKILITGASGYIGNYLFNILKRDHQVIGVSRTKSFGEFISLDLLDYPSLIDAFRYEKFDLLIHCAAIAHGQNPPSGETILSANIKMTSNIIDALKSNCENVIFMSSVAVYGECGNVDPVTILKVPKPYNDYGKSKLKSEEILLMSYFKNIYALRLAPVFSSSNMSDVKKRIQIPFFQISFITTSKREYSLCSLETISLTITNIMINLNKGKWIYLLSDSKIYTQEEILSWFNANKKIIISSKKIDIIFCFLKIIPKELGYKIRSLFWKLFKSNVYRNQAYNILENYVIDL